MSTVVFLSAPAYGHVNPTLPLITELAQRGERVFCYAHEKFQTAIEHTRATFRSYSSDFPADSLRNDTTVKENPFLVIEILLEASKWLLSHKLQEIRDLQPDYIMYDSFSFWGSCLAQALRLPAIVSVASIAFNRESARGEYAALSNLNALFWNSQEQARSSGRLAAELIETYCLKLPRSIFEILHSYSTLNIVYTSKAFQPCVESFDDRHFKFVGPSILSSADISAFPFETLRKKPLIYISLGAVDNDRVPLFRACIEAFAESEYQVVMALVDQACLELLGTIPTNFVVRGYVPQQEVLQRSVLFITHAGATSINDALYYHTPLIVIPQSVDQPLSARRVAELGAGKVLMYKHVTAESLRQVAQEVLSQPGYARVATQIGASLRAAGGWRQAADEIEKFKRENNIL